MGILSSIMVGRGGQETLDISNNFETDPCNNESMFLLHHSITLPDTYHGSLGKR